MEDGFVPFRFRPTRQDPVEAQYSISDIPISRRVPPNVYTLSPQLPFIDQYFTSKRRNFEIFGESMGI